MIRFYVDEDFDHDVVRGVRRRFPAIDLLTIQEDGRLGIPDAAVLERTAELSRVILTRDKNTLVGTAYQRVVAGLPMPGVFVLRTGASLSDVIGDIGLLGELAEAVDCEGLVRYLPL